MDRPAARSGSDPVLLGWSRCAPPLRNPPAPVPRFSGLSHEQFLAEIAFRSPAILTDIVRDWPAASKWTPQYLKERCGNIWVRVRRYGPDPELTFLDQSAWISERVRLSEYIDYITLGRQPIRTSGAATLKGQAWEWTLRECPAAFEQDPQLRQDLRFEGLIPDQFPIVLPHLWLGPAGYVTGLHADLVPFSLLAHLYGRKLLFLFPPNQEPSLYPQTDRPVQYAMYSAVNGFDPDLERHPRFADARGFQAELQPGELLYIPRGWWHLVQALEVSISVSLEAYSGRVTSLSAESS
jgi:hypothetical protein